MSEKKKVTVDECVAVLVDHGYVITKKDYNNVVGILHTAGVVGPKPPNAFVWKVINAYESYDQDSYEYEC